jgi:hypothetical protein
LGARIAPWLLVGAMASTPYRLAAQQRVFVRDPGPGRVGRWLSDELREPHVLIPPGSEAAVLPRDSAYSNSVIVLERDVIIEARVHGDVVVVGGNAYMHPGAVIDGRVVAIGGGVYESRLAITRVGTESHRDFTFVAHPAISGLALDFQSTRVQHFAPVTLPGFYSVRIPTYDRIDGLSLPVGPFVTLDTGRVEIDPTITYRSNLGAFDPAVDGNLTLGRHASIHAFVGRTTATNDDWIWSDLINSAAVLGLGLDTRNYYRADRAEVTFHRVFEGVTVVLDPFVGARAERDRSVARDSLRDRVPWSFFGQKEGDRMRRPNPGVVLGDVRSLLLGAHAEWTAERVRATLDLTNEGAAFDVGALRFVQTTIQGTLRFPTFGAQEFYFASHFVDTFGDAAPPQRWSYLGGSGTLPTLELLSMGGDHLLYFESNYFIPIQQLEMPVVGAPSVTLRHMLGSAGVGKLPDFEQNLGLRFALSFARVDVVVDPARRDWETSFGLSLAR